MCILLDCVCCEVMVLLLLWAYFVVVVVSIQVGLMLVLVTLIGSLFCVGLCVREGFVIGWMPFLWVVGSGFV